MKHKKRSATNPTTPSGTNYCKIDSKIKRKYKSKIEAELFAANKDLSQYVCPFCGHWHNGNSRKNQP